MSQRYHLQENRETSSTMSELEHQQENGNSDTKKQDGRQDGGVDRRTILDPKGKFMFRWHVIFLVSCVIAILCVDPLFFYLPLIKQEGNMKKCLALDKRLMITAICLRSVFDLIYIGNIILGYCNRRYEPTRLAPRQITKRYLRQNFLIDIFAILPIPQVLVPITYTKMATSLNFLDIRKVINLFVLLQYVPRVLRIYLSWKKHIKSSSKLYKRRIEVAFNIFLYILASHVLGGLWYFFSVQRETACWHKACKKDHGCTPSSFKCGNSLENYAFLDGACPIHPPNTTLFDFGIFQNALESGIVSSTNILQKIMYCLWWGLRNLSSLGQNLQTSTYFWENCFAVFISIYGLLLFLYFIGNAQTLMQMATERRANKAKRLEEIEGEMGLIIPKVESWMARNSLPHNMKESIISCIRQRLEENKEFDMDKLISHLSKDLVTKIKHHLCLPLLKKAVQKLENQGDRNLLAERICESLKPKYYTEDLEIIQEGKPVTAMVFTTQGSVWCFKKSNGENGDSADLESITNKFDLYGEELLEWRFNHPPSHKIPLPISTKTVKTQLKVELFTLTANDLKNLPPMQVPMHTRAAEATKVFVKGVFRPQGKENKNENSPKMSEQKGTSRLLEDGAPKSC
ncbi:cyclic nucleotide-gated ion channel 1-like [Corylus avellana]|uniref:cyclic nucleotide-gated ion channel 1-like n=1 Tax=Corylus avellana TaxID=13451 RepID=UPI00286B5D39|nr:cyclic nucleotide-gated ion channel 1-like [Corylus avellana]